jgi:hypothetical protein
MRLPVLAVSFLFLAVPAALAEEPCLPPQGEGGQKLQAYTRAYELAREKALREAGWTKLEAVVERPKASAGEVVLELGVFERYTLLNVVQDAGGAVFQIHDAPASKPTEQVVICGCQDPGGSGIPQPRVLHFVRAKAGAKLRGLQVLDFVVEGPAIRWSNGLCSPRP